MSSTRILAPRALLSSTTHCGCASAEVGDTPAAKTSTNFGINAVFDALPVLVLNPARRLSTA
ncbi:MAG: hypothetical protein JF606_23605 [Burkholderiales bacterium]|nr:hypothetical protein [Burkholderiales bacterium]